MDVQVFILIISTLSACSYNVRAEENTMRLLHVFFRHGQRTPLLQYANDPYGSKAYWPEGLAQLTTAGKIQTYELGKRIRDLYKDFIPREFRDDYVYTYSSDQSRSIMSAQTFLHGLYPPEMNQQWLKGLAWQPIPVHTMSAADDPLYPASTCPLAEEEYRRVMDHPEVFDNDLTNYLREKSGEPKMWAPYFHILLYDALKIETERNLTLPDWTKDVFPDKMKAAALTAYRMFSHTNILKRLRAGPQLGRVTSTFEKYRNKTLKPTSQLLFLYSIHDANVVFFSETLKLFEVQIPPYAAALMFELHQQSGGHLEVKIKYLNGTDAEPAVLVLSDCTELCPLDKFLDIVRPYVPEDWKTECQIPLEKDDDCSDSATLPVSFQFLLLAVLSLLGML